MKYIVVFIIFFSVCGFAQQKQVIDADDPVNYVFVKGDSVPTTAISLDEIFVLPKLRFITKKERIRYLILRRKTLKVFPYAKLATERLIKLQNRLAELKRKRQKKRYTKLVHKFLEDEFSAELKKLTKTEGQILVKLIHRQTGNTTFSLVKELRNGWRAFWYNNTASLFNISLKETFNPLENEEDFLIEDILQRAFREELLPKQKAAFPIDYFAASKQWRRPAYRNK